MKSLNEILIYDIFILSSLRSFQAGIHKINIRLVF
jgi:hypothetical protein